jgi:hypothetical protein
VGGFQQADSESKWSGLNEGSGPFWILCRTGRPCESAGSVYLPITPHALINKHPIGAYYPNSCKFCGMGMREAQKYLIAKMYHGDISP